MRLPVCRLLAGPSRYGFESSEAQTIRKVMTVVLVLMASCHVSEYLKTAL
jgi:hypothetical protein